MNKPRKVCVVTGSRADYGLLQWTIKEIAEEPRLDLQLIATGMHLSPEFGLTYKQIEADGFEIDTKIEMLVSSDSPVGLAKSLGLGTIGFSDAFERLRPDIVLLLGDRFEIFSAATAAMALRIPIAHIHGGETTEGVIDEAIRHSLTKMSHLHFVAAEKYRERIIRMGEQPERVFNVGAPGLENFHRLPLLSREDLERSIDFHLDDPTFLVVYHPETLSAESPDLVMTEIFAALDEFPDARIVFTKSNADSAGRRIGQLIDDFVSKSAQRAAVYTSLGQQRFLSLLKAASVMIGNSSSGILEAPAVNVPSINIGKRQRGREMASSVIDCRADREAISSAIRRAASPQFQLEIAKQVPPYGKRNTASKKITDALRSVELEGLLIKKFFDV